MIRIEPLETIGQDERGFTRQFPLSYFGEALFGFRKEGSISGKHYHKGLSTAKDPEILILSSGKMEFYAKDLKSGKETRLEAIAPCRIEIDKYVWHELRALEDCTFIELNSLKDHQSDTFYTQEV